MFSRKIFSSLEWSLNYGAFRSIVSLTFVSQIDLFAPGLNAKSGKFISWHPEPEGLGFDTLNWIGLTWVEEVTENLCQRVTFQRSQLTPSVRHRRWALRSSIRECGPTGLAGVLDGKLIYFEPLSPRLYSEAKWSKMAYCSMQKAVGTPNIRKMTRF